MSDSPISFVLSILRGIHERGHFTMTRGDANFEESSVAAEYCYQRAWSNKPVHQHSGQSSDTDVDVLIVTGPLTPKGVEFLEKGGDV